VAAIPPQSRRLESGDAGECIATLTYIYNHHTRELSKRLTGAHHNRHDLHVATMHVHLEHDTCLEVAVLRGEAAAVRQFAQSLFAERGVKHGQVNFVPAGFETQTHTHGDTEPHKNVHARPRE
jgi:CopG family transcriptional regulator, nickel-responsive regulator